MLLLFPLIGCTCGEKRESPEDVKKMFDALFGSLPSAKIARPVDAIPDGLDIIVTSPDPEAWRSWAESQSFVKAMMKTPLFEDFRVSRTYLTIDGLSRKAAGVASWTGGRDDKYLLWRGPTALGATRSKTGNGSVNFVLVKRVDPSMRGLVRFAAAFAMAAKQNKKDGYGGELQELFHGNQAVAFVVFKDLVIAGNDRSLVERARLLAIKDSDEKPATSGSVRELIPAEKEAGIHAAVRLETGGFAQLFGVEALGLSLIGDAKSPLVIRRKGKHGPDADALALLRYAPKSAYFAIAEGGRPSAEIFVELKHRLEEGGQGKDVVGDDEHAKSLLASADIEGAIVPQLSTGTMFAAGVTSEEEASLAPLFALRHKGDAKGLEPPVRKMLEAMTKKAIERTVLEDMGGGILLAPASDGPSAAITEDALLFALSPDRLRIAIAAGRGKAPSLKDRAGVSLAENGNAGIFVDFTRGSKFLTALYAKALADDKETPWSDASASLEPTFDALAGGGALFGRLVGQRDDEAEGALHVLP